VVALARVTQDLDEPRGPDVACSIEVPVGWFEVGATLQISLPRLLSCARCDGGGCDACERRGAFEQQAAGIAAEVAVVLPTQAAEACAPVRLRLPALGARAASSELPSGHLLLTVVPHPPEPGWVPSSSVQALQPVRQPEPLDAWLDSLAESLRPLLESLRSLAESLRSVLVPESLRPSLPEPLRSGQAWLLAVLTVLVTLICFWLFH
jgi:hypothetical protein